MVETDCPKMEPPELRYVEVGDADVAYQVVGDGPFDLLYCCGLGSHIELSWDIPATAELLTGLAAFSRLIFFDRRGTGASGNVSRHGMPNTWEEWTEDILAVLGAVGSKRAAILATMDAGPIAVLFTAMHPDMVSALILNNTSARYLEADDYPIGASPETIDTMVEMIATGWGTPGFDRLTSPSLARDEKDLRLFSKMNRSSVSPRAAAAQSEYIARNVDVRQALPLIQVPTKVLHVANSPLFPIAYGQFLANHIDGATFTEIPGGNLVVDPENVLLDEVAEFLTGERPVLEVDRILTTVLFTDIVGSTAQAASLGDQKWHTLLDAHDHAVREQLHRYRGREIKTTGDGFVASFDGPARAIRCSQAIVEATGGLGIQLRAGLHTGECEVRGDDLGGLAVHIAARVAALASTGEILVSGTVKDLVVGSGIEFLERGECELKGVPGSWKLFAVQI